ncbi:MAG TPA: hypothetical protein DEA73_08745 [Peptococcaceae bacterium]|nr:hypothetical protein [Peptococcaceae bacterium]
MAHLHRLGPERVAPGRQYEEFITLEVRPTPVEVRDRVYRHFLRQLDLYPRHKAELLRRGLSEDDIKRNGYKSIPEHVNP